MGFLCVCILLMSRLSYIGLKRAVWLCTCQAVVIRNVFFMEIGSEELNVPPRWDFGSQPTKLWRELDLDLRC